MMKLYHHMARTAASRNWTEEWLIQYGGRQAVSQRDYTDMTAANTSGRVACAGRRPASCGGGVRQPGSDRVRRTDSRASASRYLESVFRVIKVRNPPSMQNRWRASI